MQHQQGAVEGDDPVLLIVRADVLNKVGAQFEGPAGDRQRHALARNHVLERWPDVGQDMFGVERRPDHGHRRD